MFRQGESITPEQADVPCKRLQQGVLLHLLAALTGLHANTTECLQGWLENDIRYFVARNFDFGTAYAAARVAWLKFNDDATDDSISLERARWHWQAKQLDKTWSEAISFDETSKHEVIDSPYSIMPRRLWDLKSNRVVDFRMLYSAHLARAMQATTNSEIRRKCIPVYWAVSHSWTDDLHSIWTSINRYQWPVPLPQGIDINRNVRSELLGYGAEYVWIDVLCLRQQTDDHAFNLLKKNEWKLEVPTIGNIFRTADRIVRYFNGLGREFSNVGWDSDRHWLKRAWTLQEIRTEHITINGGVSRDRVHVLMNSRGTVKKVVDGEEVQVETTLRRAMRPVLLLSSEADSPRGCKMYELAREMAQRKASTPLDRVSGLLYLLHITRLPCYQEGVKPDDFWQECFNLLPRERKLELLFDYPYRASDEQWFPTWTQIMAWPEKDSDYEHISIEWSQLENRQYLGRDLYQVWCIHTAVLCQTDDMGEYVVKIGTNPYGFYTPYRFQKRIQTHPQNQSSEITLIIANPEGHAHNWLVCDIVGKELAQEDSEGASYEYTILRKIGILRTDALAELLIGGENGTSLLEPIYADIV